MKIKHTLLLAKTKFRIRRSRLVIGIIALGLLFGSVGTFCALFVNLKQQLEPFQTYGINNKYLVEARNMQFSISSNEQRLIKRALEIYNENLANGKYDETTIYREYPVEKFADGSEELKLGTQASSMAIIEIAKEQNNYKINDAKKLANKTNVRKIFHYSAALQSTHDGAITSINNGTENYKTLINSTEYDQIATYFGAPIYAIDDEIYSLYQDANKVAKDNEIPVLISSELAEKINSDIIEVCYRNSDSVEYITNALINESGFRLPSQACTQSSYQQAIAKRVRFHIIGVFPSHNYTEEGHTLVWLIQNIADSGLPNAVIIPKQQLTKKQQQYIEQYFEYTDNQLSNLMYNKDTFIFEFDNASDARSFLNNYNCNSPICPADKPFVLTEFANSSILATDISDKMLLIIYSLIAISCAVSTIILATTINRIIADSCKENAILIAIGYSKHNLQSIYLSFTTMYTLFIYCISMIFIIFTPLIIQSISGPQITNAFTELFHTPNNYTINIGLPNFIIVASGLCIFISCILTSLITIKLHLGKDIIKHLREE